MKRSALIVSFLTTLYIFCLPPISLKISSIVARKIVKVQK
ncbi:hypothetical protein LDBUL1632_01726 [Lactobacillus delbrueckii subsp. bulgaricus CNCM I-1632]|nr:hypothetical protein LDBUL1632_01726 [Lactobacillus delbrueckii subsp. bulgaricus CNCM I-1632]